MGSPVPLPLTQIVLPIVATAVLTVSACWYYYWWNACQWWASWPQSRSWESVRCNVWNLRWNLKQKPEIMKTRVTATAPKKISNRTIFKPEMMYLQVCTRTCSTFLISHHTTPTRFLLHSNFFLIQLLQKKKKSKRITLYEKNSLQSYTVQCRTKTELD